MGFRDLEMKKFVNSVPLLAVVILILIAFLYPAVSSAAVEGELYQDEKGEWKIKYLNAQPASETSAQPSAEKAQQTDTDTTEVELYQDEKGEWKVRYITLGEQIPEPEQPKPLMDEDKTSEKEVLAAEVIFDNGPAEKFGAAEEEHTFETIDDEEDDQFKEMAGELAMESADEVPDMIEKQPAVIEHAKPAPKKTQVSKAFQKENPAVYANDDDDSIRNPHHQWELGLNYTFHRFKQETVNNNYGDPIGKTNEGGLGGLHLGYEHISSKNAPYYSLTEFIHNIDNVSRYKFTLDYLTGQAEYSDVSGSSNKDFTQHILEAKAVGGYDFMLKGNTRLTPYVGFGYRYLNDSSGGILDVATGGIEGDGGELFISFSGLRQPYTSETHYFYLPMGLTTSNDIRPDLTFAMNFEFDYVFLGIHRSQLSELGDIYYELNGDRTIKLLDSTTQLDGGIGLKGSARITKKNRMFDWYIEPYIRYWHIYESDREQFRLIMSDGEEIVLNKQNTDIPVDYVEPENSTTEYGIQIGFAY